MALALSPDAWITIPGTFTSRAMCSDCEGVRVRGCDGVRVRGGYPEVSNLEGVGI